MSNWIDYTLDVLASSPTEINQIAERLKQPSAELVAWVVQRDWANLSPAEFRRRLSTQQEDQVPREREITDNLRDLLKFEAIKNLGYVHESVNKARRFRNTFKDRCIGLVDTHLHELSEKFSSAIFLLTFRDMQASYSGKRVILAGELITEVFDGDQQAQATDWVLLDIFAPYWAEYQRELEVGSLWKQWVDDVIVAAQSLKTSDADAKRDLV